MRVLLVDDHELVAETLAVSLRAEGIDVVRCSSIESDAVLASIDQHHPTLVVLDLHLGGRTALPLIAPAIERGSRVVMLTGETDIVRLAECVEAGASGVLSKSAPFDRLLDELHRAARGEELLSVGRQDELSAALRDARAEHERRLRPFAALTAKERAVLAALMEGSSADQIAAPDLRLAVDRPVANCGSALEARGQLPTVRSRCSTGGRLESDRLTGTSTGRPNHQF